MRPGALLRWTARIPGFANIKVRVYALRRNGRRFHDRGQEFVQGELQLHAIMRGHETHRVAQLRARDVRGSRSADVLPPLYHPELVAVGNGALLLRGYESQDGAGYVQEWRCVIESA